MNEPICQENHTQPSSPVSEDRPKAKLRLLLPAGTDVKVGGQEANPELYINCRTCGAGMKIFPCELNRKRYCSDSCQKAFNDPEKRFWRKILKPMGDGCWKWIGSLNNKGYGQFRISHKVLLLGHRMSWVIHNGEIPDGLNVLHKCDNPPCCNPDHLFLGTQSDNTRDMVRKGRGGQPKGEACKNHKIREIDVIQIRSMAASGTKYAVIAEKFNLSKAYICNIVSRRKWKHVA